MQIEIIYFRQTGQVPFLKVIKNEQDYLQQMLLSLWLLYVRCK